MAPQAVAEGREHVYTSGIPDRRSRRMVAEHRLERGGTQKVINRRAIIDNARSSEAENNRPRVRQLRVK